MFDTTIPFAGSERADWTADGVIGPGRSMLSGESEPADPGNVPDRYVTCDEWGTAWVTFSDNVSGKENR